MRKAILVLAGLVLLYFVFWPVPIAPERWNPSPPPGFAGVYAPNAYLAASERHAFVVGLDAGGRVVHNLQEPSGTPVATISSAEPHGGWLYLGCLEEAALGRAAVP